DPAGKTAPVRKSLAGRSRVPAATLGQLPAVPTRARRHLRRSAQSRHVLAGAAVRPPEHLRPRVGRVAQDEHLPSPGWHGSTTCPVPPSRLEIAPPTRRRMRFLSLCELSGLRRVDFPNTGKTRDVESPGPHSF